MPSLQHEGLLELFRHRPTLAAELLHDALGLQLPSYSEARLESAELTEVLPTQYRADMVVLLKGENTSLFAIVVEVQLSADPDKRLTWPLYLASLRAREKCPTALLVVTPDAGVARWCAQPIELGHPGFVLHPLVVGPHAIPRVTEARVAREDLELAVLSALAHGRGAAGQEVTRAVLEALVGLEGERFSLYFDLVVSSLNDAARSALEALMRSGTYEYQSEFARKYLAQGRQEGRQEGEVAALLEVLDARGLQVDAQARQRIASCTDMAQLRLWLRRAVAVQSVQELFEPAPTGG
jgi:hypothetical protein